MKLMKQRILTYLKMKKIRLNTVKIKNKYYLKVPDIVAETYQISNNESIEVTIHNNTKKDQVELWDLHPEDLTSIEFLISEEVHTMNMYNRIYIPEKYRFFFPLNNKDFLLVTEFGNIKTHLSSNGYIVKGLRQWFSLNGPLMPNDTIMIKLLDDELYHYEINYIKNNK